MILTNEKLYFHSFLFVFSVFIIWVSTAAPNDNCAYPPLEFPAQLPYLGKICIIIRTYDKFLDPNSEYSIHRIMTCLEQMEYPYWDAYFFSTDHISIEPITEIINQKNNSVKSKLHYLKGPLIPYKILESAYQTTDWAITQCPQDAKWLLVTNGDNEYSPKIFSYLEEGIDGVAFDFFTRYLVGTYLTYNQGFLPISIGSDIFPNDEEKCASHAISCGFNQLSVSKTDLGATVWNLEKWRKQNISYSIYSPSGVHDGSVAEELLRKNWIIRSIPLCYFSHSPNNWADCRHDKIEPKSFFEELFWLQR